MTTMSERREARAWNEFRANLTPAQRDRYALNGHNTLGDTTRAIITELIRRDEEDAER